MKKTCIFLISIYFGLNIYGQVLGPEPLPPPPPSPEFSECDCDVFVYVPLPPPDTPTPGPPNPPVRAVGDLDKFETIIDEECIRSVEVLYQRRLVNQVNNVNQLLSRFSRGERICFSGVFTFTKTIELNYLQIIRMIGDTQFRYFGNGTNPAIAFTGDYNVLDGGGEGEIISFNSNSEGLITINTQGGSGGRGPDGFQFMNALNNQIKDINLVSESPPSDHNDARYNRAIVMHNTPEKLIWPSGDISANFWNIITGVSFKGFSTAVHLRGHSNANLFSDLDIEDISDYGFWISGTVDNSYSNIRFKNCNNATAIRFDNYVITKDGLDDINGFELGELPDQEPRVQLTSQGQIENILNDNQIVNSEQFNDLFNEGGSPISTNLAEIYKYEALEAFCNMENEVEDGLIKQYGLRGLGEIFPNTLGIDEFRKEIIDFNPNNTTTYGIENLYNEMEDLDGNTLPPVCEDPSTVKETNFILFPQTNSFTNVSIYENDVIQVSHLVEAADTEDGRDHTFWGLQGQPDRPCYDFGKNNKIILCVPEGKTDPLRLNSTMPNCEWSEGGIEIIIIEQ